MKIHIMGAACYDDDTASGRTLTVHRNWLKRLPCEVMELDGDLAIEQRMTAVMGRMG